MSAEVDFKFEKYEDYFGSIDDVQKTICECPVCGAKFTFNHLPDYKNLIIQENSRCMECGHGSKKMIHVLN